MIAKFLSYYHVDEHEGPTRHFGRLWVAAAAIVVDGSRRCYPKRIPPLTTALAGLLDLGARKRTKDFQAT